GIALRDHLECAAPALSVGSTGSNRCHCALPHPTLRARDPVCCPANQPEGSPMTQLLPVLSLFTPEVVWGLFPRLLGLLYFIAIAPLYGQVLPIAGLNGLRPVKLQLQKIRQDYPTIRRFAYFPTLLWINAADGTLKGLIIIGSVAALLAIV